MVGWGRDSGRIRSTAGCFDRLLGLLGLGPPAGQPDLKPCLSMSIGRTDRVSCKDDDCFSEAEPVREDCKRRTRVENKKITNNSSIQFLEVMVNVPSRWTERVTRLCLAK